MLDQTKRLSNPMSWLRRLALAGALSGALWYLPPSETAAQVDDGAKEWAMHVLPGVEYGYSQKIVVRWGHNPAPSKHRVTAAQRETRSHVP